MCVYTRTKVRFDRSTGRSGTMVFIVQRTTYHNQRDEHVSTVDWKMMAVKPFVDGDLRPELPRELFDYPSTFSLQFLPLTR